MYWLRLLLLVETESTHDKALTNNGGYDNPDLRCHLTTPEKKFFQVHIINSPREVKHMLSHQIRLEMHLNVIFEPGQLSESLTKRV